MAAGKQSATHVPKAALFNAHNKLDLNIKVKLSTQNFTLFIYIINCTIPYTIEQLIRFMFFTMCI